MAQGFRRDLMVTLNQEEQYQVLFEQKLVKAIANELETGEEETKAALVMKISEECWKEIFEGEINEIQEEIKYNDDIIRQGVAEGTRKTLADRSKELSERKEKIERGISMMSRCTPEKADKYYTLYKPKAVKYYIENELSKIKEVTKDPKDLPENHNTIALEYLKKFQNNYDFSDREMAYIIKFMLQCKNRLYGKESRYNIMLALYDEQGSGKTYIADAFYKVINNAEKAETMQIDHILGDFGTIDVGKKLLIKFDEFGKQDKSNLDVLKAYVDGGTMIVNQKYEKPIPIEVKSSFLLTTNTPPYILYGAEKYSRRIMVIDYKKVWNEDMASQKEVEDWLTKIWENLDNSEGENNILKLWGFDDTIVMDKANEEKETAFEEWAGSLDYDKINLLLNMKNKNRKWFRDNFDIKSPTTADLFLRNPKYFTTNQVYSNCYYTPTPQLLEMLDTITHL